MGFITLEGVMYNGSLATSNSGSNGNPQVTTSLRKLSLRNESIFHEHASQVVVHLADLCKSPELSNTFRALLDITNLPLYFNFKLARWIAGLCMVDILS